MTYEFIIDGETFTAHTRANSFQVHIYQPSKQRLVAAFEPTRSSLFSRRPTGAWAHIHHEINLKTLELLQPHLVAACKQRLLR